MSSTEELGPIYTRGASWRARAEARQRRWRVEALGAGHGDYGHLLDAAASAAGANFVHPDAFAAALARQAAGKGVALRTFENMLSSQAMCFNIFAPLAHRLDLACLALRELMPALQSVQQITIEHTPDTSIFCDRRGQGGVDCDVLIEATLDDGRTLVWIIETKLVEGEFSGCGFCKPGRAARQQRVCSPDVRVAQDRQRCLYTRDKGYLYWQRSDAHALLRDDALPDEGCPFRAQLWQLWVNLTLAHEEATRRGASCARLSVCASLAHTKLDAAGRCAELGALLQDPSAVNVLDLDALIDAIALHATDELEVWITGLRGRYQHI